MSPHNAYQKRSLIIISAILAAVTLIFGLLLYISQAKQNTQLILTASQNKFKVDFDIADKDINQIESFLQKLNFPQSTIIGAEFELDSSSSARLAFITPILANLNFQKNKISLEGHTSSSLNYHTAIPDTNFKAPSSSNLSIFASNLFPIFENKFHFPDDLKSWIQTIKIEEGQYLLIFGQNSQEALIFNTQQPINFAQLQNLEIVTLDPGNYKQEQEENINFHLLKIPQPNDKNITLVLFELGKENIITTSLDTAKELIAAQIGNSPQIKPFEKFKEPTILALFLQNDKENTAKTALNFFLDDMGKASKFTQNINQISFFANGKEFFGNIDFLH